MSAFGDVANLNALTSMMEEAQSEQQKRMEEASRGKGGTVNVITPADRIRLDKEKAAKALEDKKKEKDPNAIWDDEEVDARDPDFEDDGREVPEFEINYKQHVGAEDIYLGLGNKTPSTITAGYIIVRVQFPGEKLKDLDLKVEKQKIVAQSPKYRLCTYLPHEVREEDGKAEYDAKSETLKVTLPIIREGFF